MLKHLGADPRHYQLLILTTLLGYGVFVAQFDVLLVNVLVIFATVVISQWGFCQAVGIRVDFRSALISGLSLCLLLKTTALWVAFLAAFVAIGSKFLIRFRGRHVFNPTNLGLVVVILFSSQAWLSPGQWGHAVWLAFAFACLGGLVIYQAERHDVTLAFLLSFSVLIFGRAFWLGDPLVIPLHQLQNGTLLLFAFFMISDPKTTPDSRWARILFGGACALLAYIFQFEFYVTDGLLYALAMMCLFMPVFKLMSTLGVSGVYSKYSR